jgi:hypothetical protein
MSRSRGAAVLLFLERRSPPVKVRLASSIPTFQAYTCSRRPTFSTTIHVLVWHKLPSSA